MFGGTAALRPKVGLALRASRGFVWTGPRRFVQGRAGSPSQPWLCLDRASSPGPAAKHAGFSRQDIPNGSPGTSDEPASLPFFPVPRERPAFRELFDLDFPGTGQQRAERFIRKIVQPQPDFSSVPDGLKERGASRRFCQSTLARCRSSVIGRCENVTGISDLISLVQALSEKRLLVGGQFVFGLAQVGGQHGGEFKSVDVHGGEVTSQAENILVLYRSTLRRIGKGFCFAQFDDVHSF